MNSAYSQAFLSCVLLSILRTAVRFRSRLPVRSKPCQSMIRAACSNHLPVRHLSAHPGTRTGPALLYVLSNRNTILIKSAEKLIQPFPVRFNFQNIAGIGKLLVKYRIIPVDPRLFLCIRI